VCVLRTCPLVLPHAAFKEVGLALQRNHLHPVKGVAYIVQLAAPAQAK